MELLSARISFPLCTADVNAIASRVAGDQLVGRIQERYGGAVRL